MAEITCLNCGKPNPDSAEICQYCQTPLKPVDPKLSQPASNDENIPDWLTRIRERTQQEEDAKSNLQESTTPFSEGDLPDWLKDLKEENAQKETNKSEDESQVDWLEKLRTSPVYDNTNPQTGLLPDLPAENDKSSSALWGVENEETTPDWLKAASGPPTGKNMLDDFVFPVSEKTNNEDITVPVSLSPAEPTPFIPDNRDETSFTSGAEQGKEESDFLSSLIDSDNIEPGSVPGWVEALRSKDETEQEQQSPLPFLPGSLENNDQQVPPDNEFLKDFYQTSALTNRIQLSEKQRLNVGLLKEILSSEAEPKPVSAISAKPANRLGQILLFLGIILVLLLPMVVSSPPAALPQLYPAELVSFFNHIAALPENSPVLVAVDFDPALAGEMRLASSSVLNHLMARNARITLVSSRSTGPILADSLIRSVLPSQPQFSTTDHIINLGYVPGDAAGLRSFARQPALTAAYTLDLQPAWNTPPLQGINLLSDFSSVIIITDNADTMRAWVEQVQPSLGLSPLFAILSAQVSPLIQPYLDSNQIQGGLSGISGGAMYSQILARPGFGDAYWNSFQMGAIGAILLILVGGLYHLFSFIVRKTSRRDS